FILLYFVKSVKEGVVNKKVLIFILLILAGGIFAQEDLEELSLEELLDVEVVSAAQRAVRIAQAPSVIRVITAEEIQRKGYRSVGEAIMSIPGLYVYFDGVNYNVNVRGITSGMRGNNRIIKLMINNQPVQFSYNGANFLGPELIPIEAVKRIEVVIGPGSTIYGSDAFMGVINIVPKTGDDFDGGLLALALGTENSNDVSFGANGAFGHRKENIEYMISLSGFGLDRTGLKVPETSIYHSGSKSQNDLARPYSVYSNLAFFGRNFGTLTLDANLQYLDSYAEFADWGIMTHNNRISIHNYFTRLNYEKTFPGNVFTTGEISVSGGAPNSENQLDYGSEMFIVHKDFNFMDIKFKGQVEYFPSEEIGVAMGADILSQSFSSQGLWHILNEDYGNLPAGDSVSLLTAPGDTNFSNMGIYTQAVYKPSPTISFTQGLIFSHHSAYGDFYNFRFGTVYKFSEEAHFKFLFGTSFQPPSPEQLFGQPLFAGDAIGNPNLVPEQTQTFDVEITPANTEDFGATFDIFYNTIENKIGYVYSDGVYGVENFDKISVMGAEAMIRWRFKNLSTQWNVSYRYAEEPEAGEDTIFSYDFVNAEIFEYPTLMSYSSFSYMIPQIKIGFSFEQRYIGERSASQSNIALNGGKAYKLPAYQVLNLNLYTKNLQMLPFGKTRLSLSVRNLTDQEYIEPGHNGIDIPGQRRTMYFQITHKF
ncbi:hypothetical protein DRQ33_06685, partial [bacterium]